MPTSTKPLQIVVYVSNEEYEQHDQERKRTSRKLGHRLSMSAYAGGVLNKSLRKRIREESVSR